MKAVNLLHVCNQLEIWGTLLQSMIKEGRKSTEDLAPGAEVPETKANAGILFIAEWLWSIIGPG